MRFIAAPIISRPRPYHACRRHSEVIPKSLVSVHSKLIISRVHLLTLVLSATLAAPHLSD